MEIANHDASTAMSFFSHQPEFKGHFADDLRTGVFAGDEDALLRLASHLQSCPECLDRELSLIEQLSSTEAWSDELAVTACGPARSSLMRFLEQDRVLTVTVLEHLLSCEQCGVQLTDAARSTYQTEVYGHDEVPAL
jgi:hypothetical protein